MSIYFDFKTINELTSNNYNYYRKEKEFTLEELEKCDGENGNPAYVAVEGVVYDVSELSAWRTGKHLGFIAGQDLSEQFNGCHGIIDILTNAPKVGILIDNEYINGGLNTSMNRLIRQQDTSKFTPDDWIRYTVPLVTYALREPSQGMNLQRIYQKIILMGVLVGLGKTPQEAINQVQEWQNTGAAKMLQGGTGTTTGGMGTSGGLGTGGTTTGGMGTSGGLGTGGTTTGGMGTSGGLGTGGTTTGGMGTSGGFGTGGITAGGMGTSGVFGTGGTTIGGMGTSGGFGTGGTTGGRNTRDRIDID
ncbi:cytochrome b5-like heme/steroid binding domain protein [Clostridium puniceum]|uniref:Cytochrome b5-like heme/steroid binding domain protein n=1 Tax=Clostridium puniceum TaxID=29367 RepID=A0A1S8TK94_9CLOT|nr:cytochrome b5 domain-containing protein [Clostridium puniceum]OOM78151.1 cytochrome b5-like heme/steroid binding domain protein [Clostridium puniceum]